MKRPSRAVALAAALGLALLAWGLLTPLVAEPLLRWALPQVTASWAGHRIEFGSARWSPWRLAADVQGLALVGPDGDELAAVEALHVDLAASGLLRRAWVLETLQLRGPRARYSIQADDDSNWGRLLRALQEPPPSTPPAPDAGLPRLVIEDLQVNNGRIEWIDRRGGRERRAQLEPLDLSLQDLSTLREDRGTHLMSARSSLGGTLAWEGRFSLQPLLAEGRVEANGLELARLWALLPRAPLRIAPPAGQARVALHYRVDDTAWQVERLRLQLDGLALTGLDATSPAVQFDQVVLDGGRIDAGRRTGGLGEFRVTGGRVKAQRDAQGRVDLVGWVPPNDGDQLPTMPAAAGPSTAQARWSLDLERIVVDRVALAWEDGALAQPLQAAAAAASLQVGVQAAFGGEGVSIALRDLGLQLGELAVRSGEGPDWLTVPSVRVEGGSADLSERRLAVDRVLLEGGRLAMQRGRDGELSLLRFLAPRRDDELGTAAEAPAPGRRPTAAGAGAVAADPWRVGLGSLEFRGWEAALLDETTQPAARWVLAGVNAVLQPLGGDLARPLEVQAAAAVGRGGRLSARGQVTPGTPSGPKADLRVKAEAIDLAPVQPYLGPLTVLQVVAGQARAEGRLRLSGPAWLFEGGAGVDGLRIDEPGRQDPFLLMARLDAPRLRLAPDRLDLGAVQVQGLAAELTIDQDRRLNLGQLAPREAAATGGSSTGAPAVPDSSSPAATPTAAPGPTAPRVVMERLRFIDAQLDFADLSLALPFAARIQQLNGEVAGLDSQPGAPPASIELEGHVAPNGLARARGTLQPLAPTAFSDVGVTFRNIEMTALTPYTATFAGRRIASGTLALDLDYRLRERRLSGDNRIVMERLQLGERVESASATSLPLDLIIALLQDSDGRIDLGLPVSGSLDDPQFSYGALIGKAILNLLTRVVTAPFRALSAMFGGNDALADGIGRIVFDPGRAVVLPPEREKLQRLAQALVKRPGLAVQLPEATAPADRPALRELQLRRALAALEGRPLGPDGEPGPVALQLPGTQAALEARFAQRFGVDALRALRRPPVSTGEPQPPAAPSAGAVVPARPAGAPSAANVPLPELMWQRLLDAEPVDDAALAALARARQEAMSAALRQAGLDAARIVGGASTDADTADAGVVVKLGLAAAPGPSR